VNDRGRRRKTILEEMGFRDPLAEALRKFKERVEEDKEKYVRCCG